MNQSNFCITWSNNRRKFGSAFSRSSARRTAWLGVEKRKRGQESFHSRFGPPRLFRVDSSPSCFAISITQSAPPKGGTVYDLRCEQGDSQRRRGHAKKVLRALRLRGKILDA